MEWDISRVEELAKVLEKYDLTDVEVRSGDVRIFLRRSQAPVMMDQVNSSLTAAGYRTGQKTDFKAITERKARQDELETARTSRREEAPAPAAAPTEKNLQKYVVSPIAGIFYRQSQPGNPPYAEVGQRVKKGEIVCLVEAMKMINEIAADKSGVVKEFLAENEQFVEYGAPLVLIEEE
ncbi:MAG: acetyl-CoA carboxylase biotin carboxyl carrier protein [Clostridia bacterium]|nr:acetyl-CoA carboxylase biotin carboxyl carrier protein [Clostridia bacterium]